MEVLQRTWNQFQELFARMTTSQKVAMLAIVALVAGTFGYLLFSEIGGDSYVPLTYGKAFSSQELDRAEDALLNAGLSDFKRVGFRLNVPQSQLEEYHKVLFAQGAMPHNWADEWEKQFNDSGPLRGNKEMDERKEIARAKLASQMIAALPDVESANVIWDKETGVRWPHSPKLTATVFVNPKIGHQISPQLAQAIQISIAGMKANLSRDNVTVLDMESGDVFLQDDTQDPLGDKFLQRISHLREMYRGEILKAIDYIEHVRVAVNVDTDKVLRAIRETHSLDPKKSVPVVESTRSDIRSSRDVPAKTEPGQVPNGPLNIDSSISNERTQQIELTESDVVTSPAYETLREELIGATPNSVSVSIVIPEEYYRTAVLQSGRVAQDASEDEIKKAVAAAKQLENDAVQKRVAKLLPVQAGATPESFVDVSSYVRIPKEIPETSTSVVAGAQWFFAQWGSVIGLLLFAMWSLWMLNRSMQKMVEQTPPPPSLEVEEEESEEDEEEIPELERPDTRSRDALQYIVRDNPEMTASIISKWIQDASK